METKAFKTYKIHHMILSPQPIESQNMQDNHHKITEPENGLGWRGP